MSRVNTGPGVSSAVSNAARADTRSQGASTCMPGSVVMKAMSSVAWWRDPVDRRGQPPVRGEEFDVQLRVADERAHDLHGPHRQEHAVAAHEHRAALGREPRGRRHGGHLGDAHVEVPPGVLLAEEVRERRVTDVGLEHDEVAVRRAALDHALREVSPGRLRRLLQPTSEIDCAPPSLPRRSRAPAPPDLLHGRAYSSSLGGLPCHRCTFSMKLTPRPFLVFATMQYGEPRWARARSSAGTHLLHAVAVDALHLPPEVAVLRVQRLHRA